MPSASCSVCGQPARRKCTRCGRVFCDVHIRYGNPHFTLGTFTGGTGYYCDECWGFYEREGDRIRRIMRIAVIAVGIIFLIAFVVIFIATTSTAMVVFLR
jgi:hypothetical protein